MSSVETDSGHSSEGGVLARGQIDETDVPISMTLGATLRVTLGVSGNSVGVLVVFEVSVAFSALVVIG